MRNPFAKPRTLGRWLLGSGCWAAMCVSAWLGIGQLLAVGLAAADSSWWLLAGSYAIISTLFISKLLDKRFPVFYEGLNSFSIVLLLHVWCVVVVVWVRIVCLLIMAIWQFILLPPSGDNSLLHGL